VSFGPLVSAGWLKEHIGDRDLTVIDFRWHLAGRAQGALPDLNGRDEYLLGHIPGAVFVDLEAVTGTRGGGRHPLPAAWQVQDEMQKAGVDDATKVVVYDDAGGSVAARLWFLLDWFGHGAQAVLDGGLQAWGEPLETRIPTVIRGAFRSRPPDRTRILDFDSVQALEDVPLIDARAGERYRGENEPIDPKAGHIPGALSAPWIENLGADGRFKSAGDLRDRFSSLGAEDGAVVYCGSGVNACHDLLAMELAGVPNGRLYAGSWSDWSHHDAPVATGKEPGQGSRILA
jgi:thiosulfate/3-mercaptopyruvate sulfurtransferase